MKKLENFISVIAVLLILSISVSSVSNTLMHKSSVSHYGQFYDNDEPYDILFVGTSHTYNAVSPLELWNDYGYTSYNLAMPGCRMATTYWILKNALSHAKPKLVVVECSYLYLDEKLHNSLEFSHTFFDYLPTGMLRLQAAADLFDGWKDVFQEVVFPLARYHSRWDKLTEADFNVNADNKMGFGMNANGVVSMDYPLLMSKSPTPVENVSSEYLYKLIEMCHEQGIEVLLTYLPFDEGEESQNDAAYVEVIADSYGIGYLNPCMIAECLNEQTDFFNSSPDNSHLNLSGALRYTDYIGAYISQNYDIPNRKNEPDVAERWETYYREYCGEKLESVKKQSRLELLLMTLADDNYDIILDITGSSILYDKEYSAFFRNLGIEPDNAFEDHSIITLRYGDYCTYWAAEGTCSTSIGQMNVSPFREGDADGYTLLIDGQELYKNSDSSSDSLAVFVFDHNTGELLHMFVNE